MIAYDSMDDDRLTDSTLDDFAANDLNDDDTAVNDVDTSSVANGDAKRACLTWDYDTTELSLLRLVSAMKPYSTNRNQRSTQWKSVATEMHVLYGDDRYTARRCRETIIARFMKRDKKAMKTSGEEEIDNEFTQLCTGIAQLEREYEIAMKQKNEVTEQRAAEQDAELAHQNNLKISTMHRLSKREAQASPSESPTSSSSSSASSPTKQYRQQMLAMTRTIADSNQEASNELKRGNDMFEKYLMHMMSQQVKP